MEAVQDDFPIVMQNLHKSYGSQIVLNGLDLKVARGETVAVLGRSGTGNYDAGTLKRIIRLLSPISIEERARVPTI